MRLLAETLMYTGSRGAFADRMPNPAVKKRLDAPQWITPRLAPDELADKKVFARFVTKDGARYEGVGITRVRTRPSVDSLAAIELVFTRRDSSFQFTDIVFFLTTAQTEKLKPVEGKDYDLEYDGILEPSRAVILKAELQQKLDRIDELKREIDSLRPFDAKREGLIERRFRLDWNYNSNAIEGSQVSRGETEIFLERGLTAKGKTLFDFVIKLKVNLKKRIECFATHRAADYACKPKTFLK